MAEQNHNQANDELDRALDAALAKYAAVVPRAGLEERVLANLRIEQSREATHGWWRWTLAAALAIVVVVAVALSRRSARPTQPVIANHPQTTTQGPREPERQAVNHDGNTVPSPRRGTIRRAVIHPSRSSAAEKPAENPKLDQFPSPQPLSEQERALARYARDFPQEAGLIARMQEESEKEIQQRMTEAHSESSSYSDQEER